MSRIGTFADDDLAGWVLKSPDLGSAIGAFANAVYSKNRLPMRTRELARTVIAHSNECEVCVNTRDADGPANGVDEELYDHADFWTRCSEHFSEELLADLALSCALWIGMGRVLRTLDIGQSCQLTLPSRV